MVPALLRHGDFRRLWAGETVSEFGSRITLLAIPLLALLTLHATPLQVGVLGAAQMLPFLLIGLPAGAWVDRVRRRRVMIAADLGRAVLLGSVPLAAATGTLGMTQLYLVAFGTGALTVLFDVSYQSYLPHLVGRERLVAGNSLLQASASVSQVAGPGLGGLLVQALTAPYALLVDSVSFLWSAGWIALIRAREASPERAPGRHLGREIAEGTRFVFGNRLLRAIVGCTATGNFFNTVMMTMFVVLLARDLRLPAGTIGIVFSLIGVGGVVGATAATRFSRRFGQGPAMVLAIVFGSASSVLVPLVQRGWLLWLVAAAMALAWGFFTIYNIIQVSFRQRLCPDRLLGRMNATIRFVVWGTMPLGSLLGGALGSWIGVRPTLWVGAVGSALAVGWLLASPLPGMRDLPTTPDDAGPGHDPGIEDPGIDAAVAAPPA
jgi:MFS family permease